MFSFISRAQELPPIQNYSSFDYNANNQNWNISQGANKNLFIANNSGLLEFNSERWILNDSPNNTVIRSVKVVGDKVYTGCYMEFGYWKKNEFGELLYTSLVDKLNQPMIEEEQFWNIQDFDDWILFQSLNRIYIYNTNNETFKIIDVVISKPKNFKVANTIYFQQYGLGLFKIEKGKSVLVSNHSTIKTNIIVDLLLKDDKLLAITEKGQFYFIENEEVNEWKISASKHINNINVYSCLQSKNGAFLLGTISNGLLVIDKNGELQYQFNKTNGLINNTILSIFEDIDGNIWLGLDNGLSVINLKSLFKVYKDLKGNLGEVYVSKNFDNNLYLGTNQGLFYRALNSNDEFKLIENTKGQVWSLNIIDNTLFCGHNLGTFIINNNTAQQIVNFPGTWTIKPVKNRSDLLIQGNYNGLNILEKVNNTWQFKNTLKGFSISSRFFEFTDENKIVVVNEQKGISFLETDTNYTKVIKNITKEHDGYGLGLISFNNEIIFSSNTGVEIFDKEEKKFVKDPILSQKLFNEKDPTVGVLISDELDDKIWGFANRNIIYLSQGKLNNVPYETKIPIPSSFRKNLGVAGFECLSNLTNNKYLIGNSDGYITLDLSKLSESSYNITIDKVINSNLSGNDTLVNLTKEKEFKNKDNNIEIHFSTINYNQYSETQYQHQLLGLYDKWNDWSNKSFVNLNNLPFGDYTFNVKSRVGNQESQNIATYKFKIGKPWYLTDLMIGLYVLSILLFLLLMHQIYKRYYTKQREKHLEKTQRELKLKELENEQQKMHFKNEQLNQDIKSKNRELAISTMSLIKKNEFLSTIKKELKSMQENKSNLNSVIKIIDRNLNNTDDWNLFEEAFNNADKDFMKKLKTVHPKLTPNDLRLCAYLRLNLSSKEIAPLLNISPRSVEVKRYRLRKKMNLPHEAGLTNYILEL